MQIAYKLWEPQTPIALRACPATKKLRVLFRRVYRLVCVPPSRDIRLQIMDMEDIKVA
jgi:hypothetical protein